LLSAKLDVAFPCIIVPLSLATIWANGTNNRGIMRWWDQNLTSN